MILLPVFGAARKRARQRYCIDNLRQIGIALHLYIQYYDDVCLNARWIGLVAFPPSWQFGASIKDLLAPYV